jgi:hypothetical protein
MTIIIIAAIVVATAVLVAVRFQRNHTAKPEFKTTEEMMQYLASAAVEMADKNYGTKLDYTPESIEKVDEVLGKIHEEYQRTKPSQGLQGLAMAYGAYIGEVIRRSEPGAKWEQGDAVGGERSYPLYWRGGASYVCAWCYRRITNGEEDNVWHKYVAIKNQTWKNPNAELGSPANGSQPIRSETNQTSSASGSRR